MRFCVAPSFLLIFLGSLDAKEVFDDVSGLSGSYFLILASQMRQKELSLLELVVMPLSRAQSRSDGTR